MINIRQKSTPCRDAQELITTLEETKGRAVAIAAQLAATVAAAARLDAARARYAPAAARGALLFFALAGLAAVSCMYEHSLAAFLAVFGQALAESPQARRPLLLAGTGWAGANPTRPCSLLCGPPCICLLSMRPRPVSQRVWDAKWQVGPQMVL